jgi:nicotinamidase-related amidase
MKPAALIVIDVQKAIDDQIWGRRGQPYAETNMAMLLSAWRKCAWPVIHIRHDSTEESSPYRPGTDGNAFKPEVKPLASETVIAKQTNSAFIGTNLASELESKCLNRLVICGVLLENSVEATVRMAGNLGYEAFVPEDAVASIDRVDRCGNAWTAEQVHALTLSIIDGEYATVSDTRTILGAMS